MADRKLALYCYEGCGYCRRVLDAIERLELDVEIRDVQESDEHRQELLDATGAETVPVLRIEEDGEARWLPESRDIIAYLYASSGQGGLLWRLRFAGVAMFLGVALVLCALFLKDWRVPLATVGLLTLMAGFMLGRLPRPRTAR